MNVTHKVILELLKSSLLDVNIKPLATITSEKIDWDDVHAAMVAHAIVPIARLAAKNDPLQQMPRPMLAKLTSISINSIASNEYMLAAQCEIIKWFAQANIPCAILKGSSVAVCYPHPALRALGDIDILVEERQLKRALQVLTQNGYTAEQGKHLFHVALHRDGVEVELHYAISDIPENAGGQHIQEIMSDAFDHLCEKTLHGYAFPSLSPRHQALSLLLHMERHMMMNGIGLRQLADYYAFVVSTDLCIWLDDIVPALMQCGLLQFAKVLMYACVLYLGAEADHVPWCLDISDKLAESMMMDILESGNFGNCAAERSTSGLFADVNIADDTKMPLLFSTLFKINQSIKKQHPLCRKLPVLLVFYWTFLPLRYWVRVLFGKRKRQSSVKVVRTAVARNKLYQDLKLFRVP